MTHWRRLPKRIRHKRLHLLAERTFLCLGLLTGGAGVGWLFAQAYSAMWGQ
jgi:hypothetical protein